MYANSGHILAPGPSSQCILKIKRYKHYSGFYLLWFCEPNEQFHKWYNAIDWESVKFAELIAKLDEPNLLVS